VALAGDDAIWTATLSSGTVDSDFPLVNAQSADPALLAKSTGNTFSITITTSLFTPVAVAVIQSNATSGTFNGGSITFPGTDSEGQRVHAWQALTVGAGTSWTLVLNAAVPVFVGRICLVATLYDLNIKYGYQVGKNRPADTLIQTRGGSLLHHSFALRTRWAQGVVDVHEDETLMEALDASAKGQALPMLFIPDENANDAWFARQMNPFSKTYPNIDVREHQLRFEEASSGPVNG
jgi:hypothetical protein